MIWLVEEQESKALPDVDERRAIAQHALRRCSVEKLRRVERILFGRRSPRQVAA